MDRGQGTLFPECRADWVGENNPSRVIEPFVDTLDLAALGFDRVQPWSRPGLASSASPAGCDQRLDLPLLFDRQNHRMRRRCDIETDDIFQLLNKGRIARDFERSPAVRSKPMGFPDRLYRRGRHSNDLGHGSERPMGRPMRRWRLGQQDNLSHTLRRNRRRARWARRPNAPIRRRLPA